MSFQKGKHPKTFLTFGSASEPRLANPCLDRKIVASGKVEGDRLAIKGLPAVKNWAYNLDVLRALVGPAIVCVFAAGHNVVIVLGWE